MFVVCLFLCAPCTSILLLHIPTPLTYQIDAITPGTTLRVPLPRHMVVPECSPRDTTVLCPQPTQTLEDLADAAGLDVSSVLAINPHIAAQQRRLHLGQPLRRPGSMGSLPERVTVPALGNAYEALASAGDVALTVQGLTVIAERNSYDTVERLLTVTNYSRVCGFGGGECVCVRVLGIRLPSL